MRLGSALFILFATVALATAQTALKNLPRTTISGSEYVRLSDWTKSVGMTVRWTKKDEQLQVTNRWCKIDFTVRSIKARVNGMDIRLSLPVTSRDNVPFLSFVDVQHTLQPLLIPQKNPSGKKVTTICLDAGHGGRDRGKIDKFHYEKTHTLLLAGDLSRLLKDAGFKVVLTRSRDVYVELSDRAAIANRAGADIFLSLHYNSFEDRSVRGVETYCMTPAGVNSSNAGPGKSNVGNLPGNGNNAQNMLLAYMIQRSMVRTLGLEDRGVKRARYEVLTDLKMPGVLIEAGFMSNPTEAKKIYDATHRKKTARAIFDGITSYKKIVEGTGDIPAK